MLAIAQSLFSLPRRSCCSLTCKALLFERSPQLWGTDSLCRHLQPSQCFKGLCSQAHRHSQIQALSFFLLSHFINLCCVSAIIFWHKSDPAAFRTRAKPHRLFQSWKCIHGLSHLEEIFTFFQKNKKGWGGGGGERRWMSLNTTEHHTCL